MIVTATRTAKVRGMALCIRGLRNSRKPHVLARFGKVSQLTELRNENCLKAGAPGMGLSVPHNGPMRGENFLGSQSFSSRIWNGRYLTANASSMAGMSRYCSDLGMTP